MATISVKAPRISKAIDDAEAAFSVPEHVDEELSEDLALQASLQQIGESGTEAKVMVYACDAKTKKDAFLYDCDVGEFAESGLTEIQTRYGKGEYRIRVYGVGGTGLLANRRISVGDPRTPPPAPTQQVQQQTSNLETLLMQQSQIFAQGFQELGKMIVTSQQQKPQGMQMTEVLQLMTIMQSGQRQAPQIDPLDMITKIVALQRDILPPVNSDGEVSSGMIMLKAMETLGKPLMSAIANNQAAQQAQAPQQFAPIPALAAPVPNPIPETLPPEAAQPVEADDMSLKIAMFKGPLLVMASQNADPYTYANMLLDTFSEAEIAKYVTAEDWRTQLSTVLPEWTQYPKWFESVRNTIIELLRDEPEPDTVPEIMHEV